MQKHGIQIKTFKTKKNDKSEINKQTISKHLKHVQSFVTSSNMTTCFIQMVDGNFFKLFEHVK